MYNLEQLEKYTFFKEKLKDTELDWMLDSLTGVVSRPFFVDFVRSLIADGTPFTLGLMDLDNFKFINDNYGHSAGDTVLKDMSEHFTKYLDGIGLVGRFGGDEFLYVDFENLQYEDKKSFLKEMYESETVVRRNVKMAECSPYVTATIGCATYPSDAKNYDELFTLIDKALYRGKTKGRNCYIIYVEELHKNIQINRLGTRGIYRSMQNLVRAFEMAKGLKNRMLSAFPTIKEEIHISDLFYTGTNGILRSVRNPDENYEIENLTQFMMDEIYTDNLIEDHNLALFSNYPKFLQFLQNRETEALLVVRIGMDNETFGHLIVAEPRSHRIWQEEECALLYFLAKLIASRISLGQESL